MTTPHPNARFWAFLNCGPVKLTLRPGQSLTWVTGGLTDEGFARESITWEWDGEVLTRHWCEDGRDCDGRYSRTGSETCGGHWLMCGREPYTGDDDPVVWEGVIWPAWQSNDDVAIYDEAAQAAGY